MRLLMAAVALFSMSPAWADVVSTPVPEAPAAPAASTAPVAVPDEVAAHSFRLVNEKGETTLYISNSKIDGAPGIALFDDKKQMRILINLDADGDANMQFFNKDGKIALTTAYNAKRDEPEISLYDRTQMQRATMSIVGESPVVCIYREDGQDAASMEVEHNGDINLMVGSSGGRKVFLYSGTDGKAGVALSDQGATTSIFGLGQDGVNLLLLGDAVDGHAGVSLVADPKAPYLAIWDPKAIRTMLSVDQSGGKLEFMDASGKAVRTIMPSAK